MMRLLWAVFLPFLTLAFLALPARAELQVRMHPLSVAAFEPVTLIVTDPRGGEGSSGRSVQVTIADGSDHRYVVELTPTGQPGVWEGRFTPQRPGRYTGTAVLERGDEKEIGLTPVLRVRGGQRVSSLPVWSVGSRVFQRSNGTSLFPLGLLLERDDLRGSVNWSTEFIRFRRASVNFLDVPIPWPAEGAGFEGSAAARDIDALVSLAGRERHFGLQIRIEGPAGDAGSDAHVQQIQRCVRRWGHSPAVANWYLPGETTANFRALVQAARAADPYRHLIAVPVGVQDSGADLTVGPANWSHPGNQRAIFEAVGATTATAPLPGEDSWQMLVLGGIGVPLQRYRVGSPEGEAALRRVQALANVARAVPFHAPGVALTGILGADMPGSFCRYGRTWVGWLSPEGTQRIRLPVVGRGRYRVRFWDAASDQSAGTAYVWSAGAGAELELPRSARTVFLQVDAASGSGSSGSEGGLTLAQRRAEQRAALRAARAAAQAAARSRRAEAAARNRVARQQKYLEKLQRLKAKRLAAAKNAALRKQKAWDAHLARLAARQAAHRAKGQRRTRPNAGTAAQKRAAAAAAARASVAAAAAKKQSAAAARKQAAVNAKRDAAARARKTRAERVASAQARSARIRADKAGAAKQRRRQAVAARQGSAGQAAARAAAARKAKALRTAATKKAVARKAPTKKPAARKQAAAKKTATRARR